jgi:hypothetical protein
VSTSVGLDVMERDEMSDDPSGASGVTRRRSWLWDHIGRLAGLLIAMVAIAFVSLLAFAGFLPAEGVLVFLVVVLIMIGVGGRLHGL